MKWVSAAFVVFAVAVAWCAAEMRRLARALQSGDTDE